MKLKQRFLAQNILILVVTILITSYFGFFYNYFYNLLNEHNSTGNFEQEIILIKDNKVIYNNGDLPMIRIKEILMDVSVENSNYEYKGNKYNITYKDSITDGSNGYKIITLNKVIDDSYYYRSLSIFVFTIFLIIFIIANIIIQRKNMKNIIIPIVKLIRETDKIKTGELETAITDSGYGEIKELGIAIEQLRIQLKDSIYYRQKTNENRKFLISSISHDLKTPVTSIRGYIDGVLDGVANTDEKKEYYLSKAIEKTKLINIIIEDLLLYSQLDLNQMIFEKDSIHIIKYIENCIEDNLEGFLFENKRIIFENNLLTEPFVIIDVVKFKRVVQNIIDNAKKNIEIQTGQLKIILRETNSSVIMEFRDNGKGINEQDLPYIFERFYRADTARGVEGSSGLGLAIARQIVEGLGGCIWATSEGGKGASIIISLKKIKKEEVIK